MKVKYSDIEDGHHYVSFDGGGETMAVVQKSTGRVLLYSDDLADDDWPSEEELETDDYAFIPDKFDLEIGSVDAPVSLPMAPTLAWSRAP